MAYDMFVLVDIDTTGLADTDEVVQLAAKYGKDEFSVHICPSQGFHPVAAHVNGCELKHGQLYRHGKLVETVPGAEACRDFLVFLCNTCRFLPVTLMGHNIVRFGYRFLLRLFRQHGLERAFLNVVFGVVDTMPLLRRGNIQRKELLFQKYLTSSRWRPLLDAPPDSLRDCRLLHGLLKKFRVDDDIKLSNLLDMVKHVGRTEFHAFRTLTSLQFFPT